MIRTIITGNTVKCMDMRDLNKDKEGKDPNYCINFSIATNRPYGKMVKDEDGNEKRESISDFLFCTAYGRVAETVSKYANIKDSDGKLISRKVYLEGRIEKYTATRKIPINYSDKTSIKKVIDGKEYTITIPINIKFEHEIVIDNIRFIVEHIQFLDKAPEEVKVGGNGTIVKTLEVLDDDVKLSESNDDTNNTNDTNVQDNVETTHTTETMEELESKLQNAMESGNQDLIEALQDKMMKLEYPDANNKDDEYNQDEINNMNEDADIDE